MDIALFSPSSLFPDEDESSNGTHSPFLSLCCLLLVLGFYCLRKLHMDPPPVCADEGTSETQQSYEERKHQFPGMVLFLFLKFFFLKSMVMDVV